VTLPQALAPFHNHRQFITYVTRPSSRPGKTDKIPTDWRTGHPANAHDPSIWTDYATAAAHGPVGFVFTDADPFWFLDIDACLTPTGWSPLATELCAALAGAACEVSISGTGLHLFGVGQVPKHKTKNSALGLEFYTSGRFVAIGTGAVGNAMTDHTPAVAAIVAKYFQGAEVDPIMVGWAHTPVAEWRGPVDDDELIRRACNSKSAAGAFGAKASFQQLWDADFAALCKAYPQENGYDESSADAALAQHLAFWTGKDCQRIATLMQRSRLKRPKWSEHASYIERTVLNAVKLQNDVCKDKAMEPLKATTTGVRDVVGETWLTPDDMKIMFAGCTYVMGAHAIMMPEGHLLNEGRFNAMCGGYTYTLDRDAGKPAKSAWDAFLNCRNVRFPRANACEFDPRRALGEIWEEGNLSYVNSYVPIKTPSKKGNPQPFLEHLARILPVPRDRQIILAYMAAVVQHLGVKFQWAPLIQGAPGNGKTLLSRCVTEAIGRAHCHTPKPHELASRFNDWIADRIFIAVEDIRVAEHQEEIIEALKPMITNDWLEVEGKGANKSSRMICANFMLNSNHKDAVRKTKDDRRFSIFYTAQQSVEDIIKAGMGGTYFPDLYNWLKRDGYAIVTDYLRGYAIPDELNPAGACHRAPLTSSTDEAVQASAGRLEQEIIEAIEQEHVGFRNGWVSSHFLDILIKGLNMESRYPRNKRGDLMLELGYFPHPGLTRGQVHNPVSPDGCKPRLWIMAGHACEGLRGADVARAYSEAQTDAARHLRLAAA